jgi:hypothetical protein
MATRSLIATLFCWFGGDKYTEAGTLTALDASLQEAQKNVIPFDIQNDKWVFFSDHHRGAKNRADDFVKCQTHYLDALKYYRTEGYHLCVLGDVEELWEEYPEVVIPNNSASLEAESWFHNQERYLRLSGNHDDLWNDPRSVKKYLKTLYGDNPPVISESALLEVREGTGVLGNILLIHGHQGTQNAGKNNKLSKWILHHVWRKLQILTGISCNTPATDWSLRNERDKIIYQWAAERHLMLIAGHTHVPVFASYNHRARLVSQRSAAYEKLQTLPEEKQSETLKEIERLTSVLQKVEAKLSEPERTQSIPLENPVPCYFNTGCCAFDDGDITGIEIADGTIRLVRWPDDQNNSRCSQVLQDPVNLKDLFQALKPKTPN